MRRAALIGTALLGAAACGGDHVTSPRIPADAISLRLGETRTVTIDAAAAMHVASGDAATEYTLVAFASPDGPVIELQATAEGVQEVTGPPTPDRIPASANASSSLTAGRPTSDFMSRLHAAEQELIATRGSAARAAYLARQSKALRLMTVPAVNDEMTINVSLDACGAPTLKAGRVVNVSEHLVLVEDEANPAGGFTAADYQSMADEYETLVSPVLSENFGAATDLDNNGGRTVVFFTRAVNELTPRGSSSFVISFSYARDLVPKSACAGSNEAEVVYFMVPDESGSINGQKQPASAVRARVGGSLAHAGASLRNQGRRLNVTHAQLEAPWLDDAIGSIAEELVFYRAAALTSRRNLDADQLSSNDAVKSAFNQYQSDNFNRLRFHLIDPESDALTGDGLGASGAGWQFLRYLADHSTKPEGTIWSSLVSSTTVGTANLAAATGLDIEAAERDWAIAQYVDDTGLPVDSRYQNLSWNTRALLPRITTDHNFPLSTHVLAPGTPLAVRLERGGASYWRFAVPAGQYATIHVTTTAANPAKYLSLTLVRTK
jgi:hypothetical protein